MDVGDDCGGAAGIRFEVNGVVETSTAPFATSDRVSGCFLLAAAAAAPNAESTDRSDVLAFAVTVGSETWSGTGFELAGPDLAPLRGGGLHTTVTADGQRLVVYANGGRVSRPRGLHLELYAFAGSETFFSVLDAAAAAPEVVSGRFSISR
jgi:hypothetical protein